MEQENPALTMTGHGFRFQHGKAANKIISLLNNIIIAILNVICIK